MMITATLILFTLVALLIDWFILKRFGINAKWFKIAYAAQALILDVGVLCYFVTSLFRDSMNDKSTTIVVLWLIFTFIMSFSAKFIFAVFMLVEWGLARIFKKRFRSIVWIGGAMSVGVIFVMSCGATYGRSDLRVEKVVIKSMYLPQEFDGFTVAQFSDAHIGNISDTNPLIDSVVARINSLKPDIVVQTGDLVNIHSAELDERFMKILSGFDAPVYSVMGNHDLAYYIRDESISADESINDLIDKQRRMGWDLLLNEHRWLRRGADSIALVGVLYPRDKRFGVREDATMVADLDKAFEGIDDSIFTILLSHTPSLFDSVPRVVSPNLTLSGHVHSMQMKISIGDWSWSPAKWLYPMWSGLWVDRGHYLYVNDGVGFVLYPMRVGARPEITLFELKRIKK